RSTARLARATFPWLALGTFRVPHARGAGGTRRDFEAGPVRGTGAKPSGLGIAVDFALGTGVALADAAVAMRPFSAICIRGALDAMLVGAAVLACIALEIACAS